MRMVTLLFLFLCLAAEAREWPDPCEARIDLKSTVDGIRFFYVGSIKSGNSNGVDQVRFQIGPDQSNMGAPLWFKAQPMLSIDVEVAENLTLLRLTNPEEVGKRAIKEFGRLLEVDAILGDQAETPSPTSPTNAAAQVMQQLNEEMVQAEFIKFQELWLPVFQASRGLQDKTNIYLCVTNNMQLMETVTTRDLRLLERKQSPVWAGVDLEIIELRTVHSLPGESQSPDIQRWEIARDAASGRPLIARSKNPKPGFGPDVAKLYKFHWRDLRLQKRR